MTYQNYKIKILKNPKAIHLCFEPDSRIHYVYRVTNLISNTHYYGSKTDNLEPTIGVRYFTSSNNREFRKDFKENIKNYKVKIIRFFNNKADKIIFESYLHHHFGVKSHKRFLNLMNQLPWGCDNTGFKYSEKSKRLMSSLATERELKINGDSELREKRRKKQQLGFEKFRKNTDKFNEWLEQHSVSATNLQLEIKSNPERNIKRSLNMKKAQAKFKLDPIRSAIKSRKLIESKSKAVVQLDKNNHYVSSFASQKIASNLMNYPTASGISRCVNGKQDYYKGHMWIRISNLTNWVEITNSLLKQTGW